MGKKYVKIAGAVATILGEVASSKKIKKNLLGTYSDGSTRSVVDAISGEYLSAKSKKKIKNSKKKNKKKYEDYIAATIYDNEKGGKKKKKKKGKGRKMKKKVYGKGKNKIEVYTF